MSSPHPDLVAVLTYTSRTKGPERYRGEPVWRDDSTWNRRVIITSIQNVLLERILSVPPGEEALLTERGEAETLGISRETVRSGWQALVRLGLISRSVIGVGRFAHTVLHALRRLTSFHDLVRRALTLKDRMGVATVVRSRRMIPSPVDPAFPRGPGVHPFDPEAWRPRRSLMVRDARVHG
jgi:hypothetical protein